MNMTVEQHLNMWHGWDSMNHSMMDMSDDSAMIEDDVEMMDHDAMTWCYDGRWKTYERISRWWRCGKALSRWT